LQKKRKKKNKKKPLEEHEQENGKFSWRNTKRLGTRKNWRAELKKEKEVLRRARLEKRTSITCGERKKKRRDTGTTIANGKEGKSSEA